MKAHKKFILKFIVQTILFGIFLIYFGLPALQRYEEQKVIVTVDEVETDGIPAPAVTLCGKNNKTGVWREMSNWTSVLDQCNSSDNMLACIESKAWKRKDIVPSAIQGIDKNEDLTHHTMWTSYIFNFLGNCFIFTSDMIMKVNYTMNDLLFELNRNLQYNVYIHSSDYFILTDNPTISKVIYEQIYPPQDCNKYTTIVMEEFYELNHPKDPCEENQLYSFIACMDETISRKVGCSLQKKSQRAPKCTTVEQYR